MGHDGTEGGILDRATDGTTRVDLISGGRMFVDNAVMDGAAKSNLFEDAGHTREVLTYLNPGNSSIDCVVIGTGLFGLGIDGPFGRLPSFHFGQL